MHGLTEHSTRDITLPGRRCLISPNQGAGAIYNDLCQYLCTSVHCIRPWLPVSQDMYLHYNNVCIIHQDIISYIIQFGCLVLFFKLCATATHRTGNMGVTVSLLFSSDPIWQHGGHLCYVKIKHDFAVPDLTCSATLWRKVDIGTNNQTMPWLCHNNNIDLGWSIIYNTCSYTAKTCINTVTSVCMEHRTVWHSIECIYNNGQMEPLSLKRFRLFWLPGDPQEMIDR